jgi:DNA-binding beta-propeller fold protein YncE
MLIDSGLGAGVTNQALTVNSTINGITISSSAGSSVFLKTEEPRYSSGGAPGTRAVAIGNFAGNSDQDHAAIAIGNFTGYATQGRAAVAIGDKAGSNVQAEKAIAIGHRAGYEYQNTQSIAIGAYAGQANQGNYAVSLGAHSGSYNDGQTGQGDYAISIGYNAGHTNQNTHSIVINASGSDLDTTQDSAFYVRPVRKVVNETANVLAYKQDGEVIDLGHTLQVSSGNVALNGALTIGNNGNTITTQLEGGYGGGYSISSDGTYAWIPTSDQDLHRITIATGEQTEFIIGVNMNSVHSDGTYVWVSDSTNSNLIQLDLEGTQIGDPIYIGGEPAIVYSDGTYVWVTNYGNNNVSQILISETQSTLLNVLETNAEPYGVVSNGTFAYVSQYNTNNVSVINASSNTIVATIPVVENPGQIALDSRYAWVTGDGSVSQIQLSTNTVLDTITGLSTPFGIATNGTSVYVLDAGVPKLVEYSVDATTGVTTYVRQIPLPGTGGYDEVFISMDDHFVWVTNYSDGTVTQVPLSPSPATLQMKGAYLEINRPIRLTESLVAAGNIIASTLTATVSAAIDTLNTNEAHIADLYVAGENVQFLGPTVNMDGNLFANTVTTGDVTTGTLETSGDVTLGGKLYLTGLDHETTASNILGYNPLTNEVFDTEIPAGSTTSNLQTVTDNGATTNKTLVLTNATGLQASGNISVSGTVSAQNIVGNTITGVQSGAINVLNTNELHVADMYAVGRNINFYGPTVNMNGNLVARTVTTDVLTANTVVAPVAQIDATLTKSLDVSGPATFNGVTTVSVLKFTPGGIDPALTAPTVSATVSGGVIQLDANGAVYGSNTLTSAGTITGFNVSNLSDGSHVYEYVKGVTIVALSDANTYLSKVTGSGINVMFHVFNVGGTIFIDSTKVNA